MPLGSTRPGRADGHASSRTIGPAAFGILHALLDHNVQEHVVERVVSSALPISAAHGRVRYIAEFRRDGYGVMAVWVEVDPRPSKDAPDSEPFGVVTAYCKAPARSGAERLCPEWVNETL